MIENKKRGKNRYRYIYNTREEEMMLNEIYVYK